jgi:hypothetical protein
MKTLESEDEFAAFGKEFWQRFLQAGYGTYGKADLQDLILCIANRHSKDRFLEGASNHDLATLLKISEAKVKGLRLNVALKFFQEDESTGVLRRFLQRIRDGQILLGDEGRQFSFFVENNVERRELENQLKNQGVTFDYAQNHEIVKVRKEDFFRLLTKPIDRSTDDLFNSFAKRLKKAEFKTKAGDVFKKIGEVAVDVSKDILKDVIKDLLTGKI